MLLRIRLRGPVLLRLLLPVQDSVRFVRVLLLLQVFRIPLLCRRILLLLRVPVRFLRPRQIRQKATIIAVLLYC